ncbi:hypothetical protein EVG20_g2888 [Dentipellis fragilis]|uniref:F-box domain-containing protein n=1 Tax=Dentipellis fragilis TaxID=205917 RepID=A0A4Y9Z591_9AGAM|nr:hypothetical protein EVG20_g2888 [Dentipellis fragilis]
MPSLPLELWRDVLRELAYLPNILQKGYEPYTADCVDFDELEYSTEVQSWRQDKRNAVLVCKTWRSLALPMLYEILFISDSRASRRILKALEFATVDGFPDRGTFVRQIYIHVHWAGMSLWPGEGRNVGEHLARIIERCPHLAILTYRMYADSDILRSAFDAIRMSSAARSLRKLDLCDNPVFWNPIFWELASEAIGQLPMLETLVIPPTIKFRQDHSLGIPRMPTRAMHASHLKALVIPPEAYELMLSHISELDMPMLHAIHVFPLAEISPAFMQHSSAERDWMNGKVTTIGFGHSVWTSTDLHKGFQFLAHFPNLQYTHLAVDELSQPDLPLEHSSLICIAIVQNRSIKDPYSVPEEMVLSATTSIEVILAGRFPKLGKVKIVGFYAERYNKGRTEQIAEWTRRLGERGIALEFSRTFQ